MSYLVTIGLEVHCQVKANTKMFCACRTSFGDTANTNTCPVCLGLPGALPVAVGSAGAATRRHRNIRSAAARRGTGQQLPSLQLL